MSEEGEIVAPPEETISPQMFKDMVLGQMEALDKMNLQIISMLDNFDKKIDELAKRTEEVKKMRENKE